VLSADKADMDVESFSEGILGAIVIREGEMAGVGSPIAYIAETEADLDAAKAKAGGGELLPLLRIPLRCKSNIQICGKIYQNISDYIT